MTYRAEVVDVLSFVGLLPFFVSLTKKCTIRVIIKGLLSRIEPPFLTINKRADIWKHDRCEEAIGRTSFQLVTGLRRSLLRLSTS